MGEAEADELFPRDDRRANEAYLQPDLGPMAERKMRSCKLTVKFIWVEYCEEEVAGRMAYSYQTSNVVMLGRRVSWPTHAWSMPALLASDRSRAG